MTDKEIINEFTRLYKDYGSIDKAMCQLKQMISKEKYESLERGLKGVRR